MKSKRDTLIILTPGFPENEADTTCVPPRQMFVKALSEIAPNLNIIVITFRYPFFSHTYLWHGIQVISFGSRYNSRFIRVFTNLRVWITLLRLRKDNNLIGLLSFWLGKCAFVGSSFARRYKLKHFGWLLGQDAKPGNKYVQKIKPAGGSLIALSDFIRREFKKNYNISPAHIIPVGIDTQLFGPITADRDIDLMAAGSLIPLKQYHHFLNVLSALKATLPNVKAMLCGDGPEMEKLRSEANIRGLKDNLIFTGRLLHHDVLALMQRSKVFVHTSAYEGFGTVCAEALYAGTRVVSFVKPMDAHIKHWYTVTDDPEMTHVIKEILLNNNLTYDERVLVHPIENIVKDVLTLFEVGL